MVIVVAYVLFNYGTQIFSKLRTSTSEESSISVELRTPNITRLVFSDYFKQDLKSLINTSPSTQGKELTLQFVSEPQHSTLDFGGDETWSYTIANDDSNVVLTVGYNPDRRKENSSELVQSELPYVILLALCDQQLTLSGQLVPLSERVLSCDTATKKRIEQLKAGSYASLVSVEIK
jgi:hypothetical protein